MEFITVEEVTQEIAVVDQVDPMRELNDLDLALIGGGNGVVVLA